MLNKKIYNIESCAACYFRTTAEYPNKKVLLQLTEKCNFHCKHCFVSANKNGTEMKYEDIENIMLPRLIENNVTKVTLTGGEPFVHKDLLKIIQLLRINNIAVSVCTNASLITKQFLEDIKHDDYIHFNVSLDGFSNTSHGKFRGNDNIELFNKIISNITMLGEYNKLNGILVTPNIYANVDEYKEICEFALQVGAHYVLMNPLSKFGRGQESIDLALSGVEMNKIRELTQKFNGPNLEIVYIRFPNKGKLLSKCVAGNILYIFASGDITICPYMVFAAKDTVSQYDAKDFIFGNIFVGDFNMKKALEKYRLPGDTNVSTCSMCKFENCGRGCYAAKISRGLLLSDVDEDLCPKNN